MKKVLMLIFTCCLGLAAFSQKVYFIYLQTENNTPFFVQMGDKVHSSTAIGYVIIPELVDSTYDLTVGFPGAQAAEATFSIPIQEKDKGLLVLKGEKGITLFDWQTATIYNPKSVKVATASEVTGDADHFTRLLSQAADDASLLTTAVVARQETAAKTKNDAPKETITAPAENNDKSTTTITETPQPTSDQTSVPAAVAEAPKPTASEAPKPPEKEPSVSTTTIKEPEPAVVDNELPFQRSAIMRKSESSTTEGFGLVYVDNTTAGVDTIRLLIPNPKMVFYAEDNNAKQAEKSGEVITKAVPENVTTADEKKTATLPKVSCGSLASDNDFFKLRKNMAEKVSDDDMIDEAKKVFRKKCFSTEQIKNLSALFLTPASKYQFFDAAYMHVSDQAQFVTLQSEIKDDYYSNRFKALVGNL